MNTDTPTKNQNEHSSQNQNQRGKGIAKALLAATLAFCLFQIIFPTSCSWDRYFLERNALRAQALQKVAGITNAIKLFGAQYADLPRSASLGNRAIPTDHLLIDTLNGTNLAENPKAIAFIAGRGASPHRGHRPARAGFIELGNGSQSLVDPWGNYYMIVLDADGDGIIHVPVSKEAIRGRVACWCYGQPQKLTDPETAKQNAHKDWLASWR